MSAVAREALRWLAPAPLWTAGTVGTASDAFLRPWIAESRTHSFLDDFLATVGGTDGRSPADLSGTLPERSAQDGAFRFFMATSRRYYLVAATLVCHRPGIPDHTVQRALDERAFFVLRRIEGNGTESAFVPGPTAGTWQPATAGAPVPGERELPLHPVPVAAFAAAGTTAATLGMAAGQRSARTVLYGYIPVLGGNQTKDDSPPHVIRTVLTRDPCPPVLSVRTHPFRFASGIADDAPTPKGPTP
ncbi:hypothetical protein [Streptomyces sp. NBC_01262]|uniref:hypothetical protein n=1 Tax=Streptomyces sp. NBC_01262 TaxID=2903803 RepID=UPI002E30C742|nr:hypothetical protein [Streptomyces sp. NBC_01262]